MWQSAGIWENGRKNPRKHLLLIPRTPRKSITNKGYWFKYQAISSAIMSIIPAKVFRGQRQKTVLIITAGQLLQYVHDSRANIPWTGYKWWLSEGSSNSRFLQGSKKQKFTSACLTKSKRETIFYYHYNILLSLSSLSERLLTDHTEGDKEDGVASVQRVGGDHHCK